MGERNPRLQLVLAAGAVFAVIVAAQAIAGSGNDPAARGASQQIKKLKKQVKQLKQRVASIENTGATPKGPASGDLGGNYPNPVIAPDAVTSSRIFDGTVATGDLATDAVTSSQILNGTIATADLGPNAVTSPEIANGTVATSDLAQPALQTPTLQNCEGSTPWAAAAGLGQFPRFWKDSFGVVHLQGSVGCTGGNATEGGAIFFLPAGYRPTFQGFVIRFMALGGGVTPVQLAILDDGSGAVVYDGPDSTGVDNYISLDGITFLAGG